MIRKERWRNYHNDEKVMREVKSIRERRSENLSPVRKSKNRRYGPPAYLI